jgi:hypothetical protein
VDATTGALTLVNSLPTDVQPFDASPCGFQRQAAPPVVAYAARQAM